MSDQGQDPRAPRRRSVRERLTDPPTPAGAPGQVNPLTDTTATSIGGLDTLSTSFRVSDSGEILMGEPLASIAAPLRRLDDLHVIDVDWALSHHVLLVGESVEPDELEALAVSVWDTAGWAGPGMLRLAGGAAVQGPWAVDTEVRRILGVSAGMTRAWVLVCPPARGAAPTESVRSTDVWAHAFPGGMPVGIELKVLLTLRRVARRLGGALRIQGSGDIISPDPDSAVNLSVYSPRWMDPSAMIRLLTPEFPTVIDSRDVPVAPLSSAEERRQVERIAALAQTIDPLSKKVERSLSEDRRRAQSGPQVVDGYAVLAPAGNKSELMVEARAVSRPPQVLRWEPWTNAQILEYRVRWLPGPGIDVVSASGSRAARLERLRSAQSIERAAALVVDAVGGSVIDEDGFLVGLGDGGRAAGPDASSSPSSAES